MLDLFPSHTGYGTTEPMGYYDGNTVTAMCNYAQFFAMSDNSYGTTFGPSTPGLLNLTSGQTNGAVNILNGFGDVTSGGPDGSYTVIGDPDPVGDLVQQCWPLVPQTATFSEGFIAQLDHMAQHQVSVLALRAAKLTVAGQ